ncbi:MAG: hypothetical protein ACI9NN_000485 [Bacteroidia bacterium]|jgi:hypothetical protein
MNRFFIYLAISMFGTVVSAQQSDHKIFISISGNSTYHFKDKYHNDNSEFKNVSQRITYFSFAAGYKFNKKLNAGLSYGLQRTTHYFGPEGLPIRQPTERLMYTEFRDWMVNFESPIWSNSFLSINTNLGGIFRQRAFYYAIRTGEFEVIIDSPHLEVKEYGVNMGISAKAWIPKHDQFPPTILSLRRCWCGGD